MEYPEFKCKCDPLSKYTHTAAELVFICVNLLHEIDPQHSLCVLQAITNEMIIFTKYYIHELQQMDSTITWSGLIIQSARIVF